MSRRPTIPRLWLAFVSLALTASTPSAGAAAGTGKASAPGADLSRVFDAALSGDMVAAFAALDSLDVTRMSPKDSAAAACIRTTFGSPASSESLPPRSRDILTAYRRYWQVAMLHKMGASAAESTLLRDLRAVLSSGPADTVGMANLDTASDRAKDAIEKEGLHALTGVTSPYWELMIWRTQLPETYHVKLPERTIDVRVVFMDDFASLGWSGYATCGRYHSGGWATNDALYALKSAYDVNSEDFRVSYLAHEGRHFSDYKEFPKLEQPELEYRAKLTEIAQSKETTLDLITTFARRGGRDRGVPHDFANYCVARDLGDTVFGPGKGAGDPGRWKTVPPDRIRSAARKLLTENDEQLRRMGAKDTERFLDTSKG